MTTEPVLGPGEIQYLVASANNTYTTDADFDQGTLVNVNHDAPNNNQLQLNTSSGTFPFVWIALSQRCTIAKVNTETGQVLGEYRTVSDGTSCGESSRTTVSLDGSVWVGHRGYGRITRIGLAELSQCVDRNGNGTIETSTGYGDVKPWPGASAAVTAAEDECILAHVNYGGGDSRHMSVDKNGDLWVGDRAGGSIFRRYSSDGTLLEGPYDFACGGYGGLIDESGIIWSATSGGSVLRWDPAAGPASATCIPINNYGMAVDPLGNVWVSTLGEGVVRKLSPSGVLLGTFPQGNAFAQGLAADANGDVWISSSLVCSSNCTIAHLKNNGTFVGNVPITGTGPTGVSVDANGKIWSANRSSHTATRIDPTGGPIGADGVTRLGAQDLSVSFPATAGRPLPFPYNYSDMTGAQLFSSTAPQGSWTVTQDGGAAGTEWTRIAWNTEAEGFVPAGGSITVEARAADTEAALGSLAFTPISNGTSFSLSGRFIQVRATLRAAPDDASPVLSDISIQASSDITAPFCALSATGTNASGQKYIQVTTRDTESGLQSIAVTKASNLTTDIPPFTPGTTSDVVVTATKVDQSKGSQLALLVTDVAGNQTACDPVDVTVSREAGKPIGHTFTEIPAAERWVEVYNGSPGLTNLRVEVNGTGFQVAGLKAGEHRTLDVASAMSQGSNNTVALTPTGRPGGSAWVLVHD